MDVLFNILLFLHFVALVVGGTNAVVMPVIGSRMPGATPDLRQTLFGIAEQLASLGKGAMGVLLITGPLMLWVRYGWQAPNHWFWLKMLFIVVMLFGIVQSSINGKKARGGDQAAAGQARMFGMVTSIGFLGVILAAVFAFN